MRISLPLWCLGTVFFFSEFYGFQYETILKDIKLQALDL